jgi:tol-pal system beta propeller repeat protein TolB
MHPLRIIFLFLLISYWMIQTPPATTTNPAAQTIYLPFLAANLRPPQLAYAVGWRTGTTSSVIHTIDADGAHNASLTTNYASQPAWSPHGARLAFICADTPWVVIETPRALCVMQPDGSNMVKLTFSSAITTSRSPDWLPDGRQLLFSASRDGFFGNFDIYRVASDGSQLTQLTDDPAADSDPAISPDGTQIAFSSTRAGKTRIYLMNADGTNQRALTDGTFYAYSPAWSPDGTQLAFAQSDTDGYTALMVMQADGAAPRQLRAPGVNWLGVGDPAWSSDGKQIAYTESYLRFSSIYIMNSDGTDNRLLTAGESPAWRP